MPAETHQLGREPDAEHVLVLLQTLLDDPTGGAGEASLASLGVDDAGLVDLWEVVCEELCERTLGPEIDDGDLDPSMSLRTAAEVMTRLLGMEPGDGI